MQWNSLFQGEKVCALQGSTSDLLSLQSYLLLVFFPLIRLRVPLKTNPVGIWNFSGEASSSREPRMHVWATYVLRNTCIHQLFTYLLSTECGHIPATVLGSREGPEMSSRSSMPEAGLGQGLFIHSFIHSGVGGLLLLNYFTDNSQILKVKHSTIQKWSDVPTLPSPPNAIKCAIMATYFPILHNLKQCQNRHLYLCAHI